MGKERYLRYVQSVFFQHIHLRENLSWSSLHYYMALVHNIYMVCVNDFLHVMGNKHHRNAFLSIQFVNRLQHFFSSIGVQHGGGLVQHNAAGSP